MARNIQETLVLIKPDAVARNIWFDVIRIYLNAGLEVIAAKIIPPNKELVEKFYQPYRQENFYQDLVDFMASGIFIALWIRGEKAVGKVKILNGDPDPAKASRETIRARFGKGLLCNAVHGSDSEESARREIALFFPGSQYI